MGTIECWSVIGLKGLKTYRLLLIIQSTLKCTSLGLASNTTYQPRVRFKDKGFEVTKHYTLETAFRASSGSCGKRVVGLICEYDALPGIGHACGHNLIAEVGVGAALGK